jgi:hypothetical protein
MATSTGVQPNGKEDACSMRKGNVLSSMSRGDSHGTCALCQNGRNPDKAANTSYFSRKGIHLVQTTTNWWGMSTILGAFLALKWGTQFIFWPKK